MSKLNRYENVQVEAKDGKLVITCVIDEAQVDVQPSASGKTLVLATTGGAQIVPGSALKLNLTLYRKP